MEQTQLKVYRSINMGIIKEWIDKSDDFITMVNREERECSLGCRNTCYLNKITGIHPFYQDNPECHNLLRLSQLDSEYGWSLDCYEEYFLDVHGGNHNSWGYREILSEQDFATVRDWVLEHNGHRFEELQAGIEAVQIRHP